MNLLSNKIVVKNNGNCGFYGFFGVSVFGDRTVKWIKASRTTEESGYKTQI